MLRAIAIAAVFALALPNLAAAQGYEEHRAAPPHPAYGGPPHPAGPPVRPAYVPHGPVAPHPGPMAGPHPVMVGGPHPQFGYHGRMFAPVHISPFIYPPGWAYRRWAVGAVLPPLFLAPAYYYTDWATLGLDPPPPGAQWVRYGPDLLLVNVHTGRIADVVDGVFY
jgi:hypothetical protein